MLYKYIIPSGIQAEIDKSNYGREVTEKLDFYLNGEVRITEINNENEFLISNLWISKPKKNSGPRYIWYESRYKEACVYALRKIYQHDEYDREVKDDTKEKWLKKNPFTDADTEEINKTLEQMLSKDKRKFLPAEYKNFEKSRRPIEWDELVYESDEWRNEIVNISYEEKKNIHRLLNRIANSDLKESKQHGIILSCRTEESVVYYRIIKTKQNQQIQSIFLLYLQTNNNLKEEHITHLLHNKYYDREDQDEMLKRCFLKSYSIFVLVDDNPKDWIDIEDYDKSNLSLSKDEWEMLIKIEYPFFLSGLSGSGKSTILQYLFAILYSYQTVKYPKHRLLFLSYSERLADNAKESVSSLLLNPSNKFNISKLLQKESERGKLNDCFLSFTNFIKNEFLDRKEEKDMFLDEKRINYENFKERYENDCKLPERRKYSSALVWSIIRTYIKGMGEQGEFLPEDYARLSYKRKSKIIEQEDYVNIYKIHKQFYSKLYKEKKGWDDMDLIRYALKKVAQENAYEHLHQFSAIFCDEMQDFTKLELSLIFKLTVHSQYRMDGFEDLKLPIALAGDPNQTISPTGFSLSSIQEIFKDVFNNNFDREKNINSYELKNNYRSKEQIVKFANTIHLIRNKLFNNGRPVIFQEAWNIDNPAKPNQIYVSFISCEDNFEEIQKSFRKSNIITADDGEYNLDDRKGIGDEYTQKRKDFLGISEINGKADNEFDHRLYTALSSKGLEFSTTILYRFSSDDSINLFTKKLQGYEELSTSEWFKLSHYFTKLYISITRARNALFIVDTQDGYEKFWRYFIQKDCWQILKGQLSISENELLRLGRLEDGDFANFQELLETNFRPEEDAKTLFKIASKNKNKEKMLRAARYFHDAGIRYASDEELCKAYILKYDNKYKEAGDSFLKLNYISDAVDCYWNGCLWDSAVSCDEPTDEKSKIEWKIALYLCDEESWESLLKYLRDEGCDFKKVLELFEKESNKSGFLNAFYDNVEKDLKMPSKEDVKSLNKCMDYFFNNDSILSNSRALLYYKTNDYKRAVQLWEAGNVDSKPNEYYLSKIEIDRNDSNKIGHLNYLKRHDEIIKNYGDPKKANSLSLNAQKIVFDITLSKKGFKKALEYPCGDYGYKYRELYKYDKLLYLKTLLPQNGEKNGLDKMVFQNKTKACTVFKKNIEKNDFEWFCGALNLDLLNKIFASEDWEYFKNLKAIDGYSIIEKYCNRSILISATKNGYHYHRTDVEYGIYLLGLLFSDENTYECTNTFFDIICVVLSRRNIEDRLQISENKELLKKIRCFLKQKLSECNDSEYDSSKKIVNLCAIYWGNPVDYVQTLGAYESISTFLDQNSCKAIIKWIKVKMGYLKIVPLSSTIDVLEKHMKMYCLSATDIVWELEQDELLSMLQRIDNSELKFEILLELFSQKQSSCEKFESILRKVFLEEISCDETQNSGRILFLNYCVTHPVKIHDDNLLRIIKIKLLYFNSRFSKNINYTAELRKIFGKISIDWLDLNKSLSEDETIYLFLAMLKSEMAMDVMDSFLKWVDGKYTYFSRLYEDSPELQSDLMKSVISHFSLLLCKKKRNTTLVLINAVRSMFSNQNVKEIYNAFINEIEKEKKNLNNCYLNNGRVEPYYLGIEKHIMMNLKDIN